MLRSLRTSYHQFAEHWAESGLSRALKLSLFKREQTIPVVKDLTQLKPIKGDPDRRGLELLEIDSMEIIESEGWMFGLNSRRERAASYFEQGFRAFAWVKDRHIVAEIWSETRNPSGSPARHPHVEWFGITLGDEDVYLFDMYVLPDKRGGAIATDFMSCILHHLRNNGFARAYGCFAADNVPALWVHRMLGYEEFPPVLIRRFLLFETATSKT
jgi:GNAT superfamily N-acetyltransferase